jgi:lysophospholipase L1-like esterase
MAAFSTCSVTTSYISSLLDLPNDSGPTPLTSTQLKAKFDQAGTDLKNWINAVLITQLESVTDSASGADRIGMTPITETGAAATPQAIIEALITRLKATTDGASGADLIGATAVSGLSGTKVQALIESLKSYLDTNFTTKDEITNDRKLSDDGDYTGSWFGIASPEYSEPGIAGVVASHTSQLATHTTQLAENAQEHYDIEGEIAALNTVKASTTYVNTQIAASQRAIVDYNGSLADLNADGSADPTKNYLILDSSDTTNYGYVCKHNGTAWVQGWKFQQMGVADNEIEYKHLSEGIKSIYNTIYNTVDFNAGFPSWSIPSPLASYETIAVTGGIATLTINNSSASSISAQIYRRNFLPLNTGDKYVLKIKYKFTSAVMALDKYMTISFVGYTSPMLSHTSPSIKDIVGDEIEFELSGIVTTEVFDNNCYINISIPGFNAGYAATLQITEFVLYIFNDSTIDYENLYGVKFADWSMQSKLADRALVADNATEAQVLNPVCSNVICWGDSLTRGAGGDGTTYPSVLEDLISADPDNSDITSVSNYGVGGETVPTIVGRMGAIPVILEPVTINGDGVTLTEVNIHLHNGAAINPVRQMTTWSNIYQVNGRNCVLSYSSEKYYMKAETSGVNIEVARPTVIINTNIVKNRILCVCMGENGWGTSDVGDLINYFKAMIDYNGTGKYIIIGRPTGDADSRASEEYLLSTVFGYHYINMRSYISAYGIADSGLSPTSEDEAAMLIGAIPPSLRADSVHLNAYGYTVMGNQVYKRGQELGYWS